MLLGNGTTANLLGKTTGPIIIHVAPAKRRTRIVTKKLKTMLSMHLLFTLYGDIALRLVGGGFCYNEERLKCSETEK